MSAANAACPDREGAAAMSAANAARLTSAASTRTAKESWV